MVKNGNKVFLLILDGYGIGEEAKGNAVKLANTPFLLDMIKRWSNTCLIASGRNVGLPAGQMGNSEVGHLNLGAGRIVYQDITRIDKAIEDGEFFTNQAIVESLNHAKSNGTAWHLIGLVSDGGVHSDLDHLYSLLETAKEEGINKVYLHALTDGRDTSPNSGEDFIRQVESRMTEIGVGRIASVCGRYWAMDRDHRWQRIERAYRMLVYGEGLRYKTAVEAVSDSYKRGVTDEFVEPSVVMENDKPVAVINDGDALFFFNFRADRAREISIALNADDFYHFDIKPLNLHYTTMTKYREDFEFPVAFGPSHLENILGKVLSDVGLKQFRIAETEKYAHVTFFFNGGDEKPFKGEDRVLIASPHVPTYDLQPEMSAAGVVERGLKAFDEDYSFILLNFANPDMVGHTGIQQAAIQALEALDPLVKSLVEKANIAGYTIFITADHGNCEQMIDDEGKVYTAHTTNPVPFVAIMSDGSLPRLRSDGILGDVAPTILEVLGIPQPTEMTGRSLFIDDIEK